MMTSMVPSTMRATMQGCLPAVSQRPANSFPTATDLDGQDIGSNQRRKGSRSRDRSRSNSDSSDRATKSRRKQKNHNVYDCSMRAKVAGSANFLHGLAKSRRGQMIEKIYKRFDVALVADLSSNDISKLLWMQTKVKPTTKVKRASREEVPGFVPSLAPCFGAGRCDQGL